MILAHDICTCIYTVISVCGERERERENELALRLGKHDAGGLIIFTFCVGGGSWPGWGC